ncbi:MAG: hypothetical protein A2X59_00075 [Nitrospirae bacterium GWC2_42_7]|nr:MAG: hypothetical protein A2X59_00075 [Nitrospirae bacterium GWC2_42_7]
MANILLSLQGDGTPEVGGTMVRYTDEEEAQHYPNDDASHLFTLRYMTRQLLGIEFDDEKDIFELWEFKGETLRSLFIRKNNELWTKIKN